MLAENEALVRLTQARRLVQRLMRVVLEHVDERLTFMLVGVLHELLRDDEAVLDWLKVGWRNLLAVVAQSSADDGHEGGVLDVFEQILLGNA